MTQQDTLDKRQGAFGINACQVRPADLVPKYCEKQNARSHIIFGKLLRERTVGWDAIPANIDLCVSVNGILLGLHPSLRPYAS